MILGGSGAAPPRSDQIRGGDAASSLRSSPTGAVRALFRGSALGRNSRAPVFRASDTPPIDDAGVRTSLTTLVFPFLAERVDARGVHVREDYREDALDDGGGAPATPPQLSAGGRALRRCAHRPGGETRTRRAGCAGEAGMELSRRGFRPRGESNTRFAASPPATASGARSVCCTIIRARHRITSAPSGRKSTSEHGIGTSAKCAAIAATSSAPGSRRCRNRRPPNQATGRNG